MKKSYFFLTFLPLMIAAYDCLEPPYFVNKSELQPLSESPPLLGDINEYPPSDCEPWILKEDHWAFSPNQAPEKKPDPEPAQEPIVRKPTIINELSVYNFLVNMKSKKDPPSIILTKLSSISTTDKQETLENQRKIIVEGNLKTLTLQEKQQWINTFLVTEIDESTKKVIDSTKHTIANKLTDHYFNSSLDEPFFERPTELSCLSQTDIYILTMASLYENTPDNETTYSNESSDYKEYSRIFGRGIGAHEKEEFLYKLLDTTKWMIVTKFPLINWLEKLSCESLQRNLFKIAKTEYTAHIDDRRFACSK